MYKKIKNVFKDSKQNIQAAQVAGNKENGIIFRAVDSLYNLVANMNTSRDKRSFSRWQIDNATPDFQQLLAMYKTNWMAAKVVDLTADEMVREWRKFSINDESSEDITKAIEKEEDRLQLADKVNEALKWARLFGGSTIVMAIEGTGEMNTPLNLNRVKKGSIKFLNVVERPLVFVEQNSINTFNPLSGEFGEPEFYLFANSSLMVHASRVIRFKGKKAPRFYNNFGLFWGDSVLEHVRDPILDATQANTSVSSLTLEANVDVIKVEGLRDLLATNKGAENLQKRFEMGALMKSNNGMMLISSEEEYVRNTISFGGLSDIVDRFLRVVSASTGIPSALFLGESASGLADTGREDLRKYYDRVAMEQERDLRPQLNKLDQVLVRSALGEYPEDLEFDFEPLWQLDPEQEAQRELTKSQVDVAYLNSGLLDEETVLRRIQADSAYNVTDEQIEQSSIPFSPDDANANDTRISEEPGQEVQAEEDNNTSSTSSEQSDA